VATFNNKDVGSRTATINSVALSNGSNGGLASNYSLSNGQTAAANITAKALTATIAAPSKVYDGTTTATPTFTIAAGLVGSETVTATGAGTFNSKDVSTATTVTANSNTLSNGSNGGLASNYSLSNGQTTAANITAKVLTMSGLSSADKVYDGTTTAVVSDAAVLQAAITAGSGTSSDGKSYSVDSVSLTGTALGLFNSKDVGIGRTVSFSGKSLTGTGSGNYTLTQQGDDTGKTISAKAPLTVNPAAVTTVSASVPPPLLLIQSNTPSAIQVPPAAPLVIAPNIESIVVTLVRQPSLNENGAVSVSLPKGTLAVREGFSFLLPTKIAETISNQSTLQITTLEGAPLPAWLRYDVDSKMFVVSAVPDGELPMRVLVSIDQQQTVVVIYERTD
jgi:hypothetical protein